MTGEADEKKISRSPRVPGQGRRPTVTFRCRHDLQSRLQDAADGAGRSLSEEIERRLDKSFSDPEIVYRTSEQVVRDVVDSMMRNTYKEFGGYEGYTTGKWFGQTFSNRLLEVKNSPSAEDAMHWYRNEDSINYLYEMMAGASRIVVRAMANQMKQANPTLTETADRFNIDIAGLSDNDAYEKIAEFFKTLPREPQAPDLDE